MVQARFQGGVLVSSTSFIISCHVFWKDDLALLSSGSDYPTILCPIRVLGLFLISQGPYNGWCGVFLLTFEPSLDNVGWYGQASRIHNRNMIDVHTLLMPIGHVLMSLSTSIQLVGD